MEKSGFFNSSNGDRKYGAADFADYFGELVSSGIFRRIPDNLMVTAGSGMNITVLPGSAWIDGYRYENTEPLDLPLATAGGINPRIDRIVIRWSAADRNIRLAVLTGAASANPAASALTRNAETWELGIADVTVKGGVVSIMADNITDTRLNADLCGSINSLIAAASHTHVPIEVGLGNVPNVATNDQKPTYTEAGALGELTSGESLTTAFGKLKKAVKDLIAHIANKANPHSVTAAQAGAVPTSRTVNSKALSGNITLAASDVGAVPTTRTVNGKALSANITLSNTDVGAAAASHNHATGDITSGTLPLTRGGTGQTTAAAARDALGLGNTTGALPVANGGTGAATYSDALGKLIPQSIIVEGSTTGRYSIKLGRILINYGTVGTTGSGVVRGTFSSPFANTNYAVVITPQNTVANASYPIARPDTTSMFILDTHAPDSLNLGYIAIGMAP